MSLATYPAIAPHSRLVKPTLALVKTLTRSIPRPERGQRAAADSGGPGLTRKRNFEARDRAANTVESTYASLSREDANGELFL